VCDVVDVVLRQAATLVATSAVSVGMPDGDSYLSPHVDRRDAALFVSSHEDFDVIISC
jgi:hypothetical protein